MWGAVVDNMKLTTGDWIGASVALVGVLIVLLWPRDDDDSAFTNTTATDVGAGAANVSMSALVV